MIASVGFRRKDRLRTGAWWEVDLPTISSYGFGAAENILGVLLVIDNIRSLSRVIEVCNSSKERWRSVHFHFQSSREGDAKWQIKWHFIQQLGSMATTNG